MDARGIESKAELARFLEVEPVTLGRWMDGTSEPSLNHLRQIRPKLRGMTLPELIVASGQVPATEMGLGKPKPMRPMPVELERIMKIVDDDLVPRRAVKILLQGVDAARRYWVEMFLAPIEVVDRMRERVSSGRR